jgi:hypothetical protein
MPENPLSLSVIKIFTICDKETAHDKQSYLAYYLYAEVYFVKFIPSH